MLGATIFIGGVTISAEVSAPSKDINDYILEEREAQIEPSSALVIVDKQKQLEEIKAEGERLQKEREEAERLRLAKIEAERKAKEEAERKAREEREQAERKAKGVAFNGSYYTPRCTGCSGITATGVDVRKSIYYQGMRVVAVDPRVIPLHSIVQVTTPYESFKAIALDTGGAIKGHKIDILVADKATAYKLGRHTVHVSILRNGK